MSAEEPKRVEAELLTAAQARELRRLARRSQAAETARGLKVLRRATRRLETQGPGAAVRVLMQGFGAIILDRLREWVDTGKRS